MPRRSRRAPLDGDSGSEPELAEAYHAHVQQAGSLAGQLRRLVSAHQAAAARLATAELQVQNARAAGLAAIAGHMRELRAELDSCALRAARELEEEIDELRLPLAAQARALERCVARLEAAAHAQSDARRQLSARESVAAFARAARGAHAAVEAGKAAAAAAGAAGGDAGGAAGSRLRGVRWFKSLRVAERQLQPAFSNSPERSRASVSSSGSPAAVQPPRAADAPAAVAAGARDGSERREGVFDDFPSPLKHLTPQERQQAAVAAAAGPQHHQARAPVQRGRARAPPGSAGAEQSRGCASNGAESDGSGSSGGSWLLRAAAAGGSGGAHVRRPFSNGSTEQQGEAQEREHANRLTAAYAELYASRSTRQQPRTAQQQAGSAAHPSCCAGKASVGSEARELLASERKHCSGGRLPRALHPHCD